MLKWIGGGCVVILLIVGVVVYAGYQQVKKLADQGPSVTVSIAATPERVFASMANADSMSTWFLTGTTLQTARKGAFVAGDTVFVAARNDSMPTAWIYDSIVPNQLLMSHWTMLRTGMVIHRRRDSLSFSGDSTRVTTTIQGAMMDSIAAMRSRAGEGMAGGMMDVTAKLGVASARLQAEAELKRLKARIEGPTVVRP